MRFATILWIVGALQAQQCPQAQAPLQIVKPIKVKPGKIIPKPGVLFSFRNVGPNGDCKSQDVWVDAKDKNHIIIVCKK